MKQKWIILFGMVAVALIFAACGGDSGNNSTETEGNSSSSTGIYSSGGQLSGSSSSSDLSSVNTSSSSSIEALSSSLAISSSSANEQSSSSSVPGSSSAVDPSSVEYGSFSYGGQMYRTVTIGTQTWMAENLNYADSAAMPNLKGNSWCYENRADSCAKYGRFYKWTGAMNIDTSYQYASATAVISTPHQGACPAGWHIPTDNEWTTLENTVGGSDTAGTKLKSTSGWNDDGNESGNGTDAYGFSALPAGSRYSNGDFDYVGNYAHFWSATEDVTGYAYGRRLFYDNERMYTYHNFKGYAFSVRCVKD